MSFQPGAGISDGVVAERPWPSSSGVAPFCDLWSVSERHCRRKPPASSRARSPIDQSGGRSCAILALRCASPPLMAVLKPLPKPCRSLSGARPPGNCAGSECVPSTEMRRQARRETFGLEPVCKPTPFEPDAFFHCSKESSVRGYSDVDHRVDNSRPDLGVHSEQDCEQNG